MSHAVDAIARELLVPKWQPIETAPAGKVLLVWGGAPVRFGFLDSEGIWRARHGGPIKTTPTHWMLLPEPPP